MNVNLALNKPVEVSSTYNNATLTKNSIVDGIIPSTVANGWASATGNITEYFQIDLENIYIIQKIRIYNSPDILSNNFYTSSCKLFTSLDGVNFDFILDMNMNKKDWWEFNLPDIKARYIKCTYVSGVYSGSISLFRVGEFEIYGHLSTFSLIKSSNKIYTFEENEWIDQNITNPTQQDFEDKGMFELNTLVTPTNKAVYTMEYDKDLDDGKVVRKVIDSSLFNNQISNLIVK